MSRPNLEVDQSAMELVGYQSSHKEIWDIYHSVYLLRRSQGLPPGPKDECLSRLSRRELYEEALKVAHQRALETAEVLRSDIERLSQGMRDVPQTCSRSHSRSCSRSHGRSHSKSHPQRCSLDR